MLDTHPLCCENHTSPPVANCACYTCIYALPGFSFFVSVVFLNGSGTFWTQNIVHYLFQQYLTTFFRSPEKLMCVNYCRFPNEPLSYTRSFGTDPAVWHMFRLCLTSLYWQQSDQMWTRMKHKYSFICAVHTSEHKICPQLDLVQLRVNLPQLCSWL